MYRVFASHIFRKCWVIFVNSFGLSTETQLQLPSPQFTSTKSYLVLNNLLIIHEHLPYSYNTTFLNSGSLNSRWRFCKVQTNCFAQYCDLICIPSLNLLQFFWKSSWRTLVMFWPICYSLNIIRKTVVESTNNNNNKRNVPLTIHNCSFYQIFWILIEWSPHNRIPLLLKLRLQIFVQSNVRFKCKNNGMRTSQRDTR